MRICGIYAGRHFYASSWVVRGTAVKVKMIQHQTEICCCLPSHCPPEGPKKMNNVSDVSRNR